MHSGHSWLLCHRKIRDCRTAPSTSGTAVLWNRKSCSKPTDVACLPEQPLTALRLRALNRVNIGSHTHRPRRTTYACHMQYPTKPEHQSSHQSGYQTAERAPSRGWKIKCIIQWIWEILGQGIEYNRKESRSYILHSSHLHHQLMSWNFQFSVIGPLLFGHIRTPTNLRPRESYKPTRVKSQTLFVGFDGTY